MTGHGLRFLRRFNDAVECYRVSARMENLLISSAASSSSSFILQLLLLLLTHRHAVLCLSRMQVVLKLDPTLAPALEREVELLLKVWGMAGY